MCLCFVLFLLIYAFVHSKNVFLYMLYNNIRHPRMDHRFMMAEQCPKKQILVLFSREKTLTLFMIISLGLILLLMFSVFKVRRRSVGSDALLCRMLAAVLRCAVLSEALGAPGSILANGGSVFGSKLGRDTRPLFLRASVSSSVAG